MSGYLIKLKPDLVSIDGPAGTDQDITDLHARCEVYLQGAGRIGLDPTSGLLTVESHILLSATPNFRNVAPSSGMACAADVESAFDMQVTRFAEHPRFTKPFSDASWAALDALGQKVDAALPEGDVRLTMGDEPTFVSIDDFEADEWNTSAVGPTKRGLADDQIRRLRDRFAPNGFLHSGQGKWYPGETLPRWTCPLYWRRNEMPIWRNDRLIAREGVDSGAGPEQTAEGGVGVGGVRFKAWKAAGALHPSLPIDAPLVIDIYDRQTGRAVGGCTYQVAHPVGRNYETFPVNANEARARRLARFEAHGRRPGMFESKTEPPHPEFPFTLDLRRTADT